MKKIKIKKKQESIQIISALKSSAYLSTCKNAASVLNTDVLKQEMSNNHISRLSFIQTATDLNPLTADTDNMGG